MPKLYKFEEPDTKGNKWAPIREELQKHIGEWALVIDGERGDTVTDLQTMRTVFPRKKGYAIRARNVMDEPLKAWMMYDPENVKSRAQVKDEQHPHTEMETPDQTW